jgi:hypothetical protein
MLLHLASGGAISKSARAICDIDLWAKEDSPGIGKLIIWLQSTRDRISSGRIFTQLRIGFSHDPCDQSG